MSQREGSFRQETMTHLRMMILVCLKVYWSLGLSEEGMAEVRGAQTGHTVRGREIPANPEFDSRNGRHPLHG